MNRKYRPAFMLPLILNMLDINIPNEAEEIVHYNFAVMTLSIIILSCFCNVVGYLSALHILNQSNFINNNKDKYPKLYKLFKYYSKSSLIFVFIEGLICVTFLLFIIISSLLLIKNRIS